MRVMGLDPSTRAGIAIVDGTRKVLHAEEIKFPKLDGFERIQAIAGRVFELKEEFSPDLIVVEEMIVGASSSAITVIQVASILRYFLWQEGIQYVEVHPSSLKVFVGGSGNSTKEQMMMAVLKNWGYESKTNNIADAVGLGMAGLSLVNPKTSADKVLHGKVVKKDPRATELLKKFQCN